MAAWIKREKVLVIALVLALLSAFLIPPDAAYLSYIDMRVLALLFSLMLLVRGLQQIGLFDLLIAKLFSRVHSSLQLNLTLVLLCFVTSMLITNDVALLTFVPLALLALRLCGLEKLSIRVVVLQTIAANLGSMATPIGNPQNLYLFSTSGMDIRAFFALMLPLTLFSLALVAAATLLLPRVPVQMHPPETPAPLPRTPLVVYCLLFVINLLVVLRVLHWVPALLLTVAGVLALRQFKLFLRVDYALLLTFIAFFVFVGNIGRVEAVRQWVNGLLADREVLVSALFSQVISNVPAALLLSGFTENFAGLLVGTNVGGLGTLIASMASLISYKLYAASENSQPGRYLLVFTIYNVLGFAVLLAFHLLLFA